ncbi:MAG TPA: TlyA family RNA methyltransferase [Candidatus Binatia bacterium]|nr:TlyA family RNA methyltransferase [Candidatus Binatia bacterium]
MGTRERIDKLLMDRGLVASREAGRARILAGEVLVNERPVTKAGSLVDSTATIRLRSRCAPYVSRGGAKLAKALGEFNIDVAGKLVLDVGASTGGFTDCLLQHGAARVFAVDVGYGQLDWRLRSDPRVVVFEKTNIRYLELGMLPSRVSMATVDVSFISLKLVLPPIKKLLEPAAPVVALIKPQFEVGKGQVGKGGVVRSPEDHQRVIEEITSAAAALDLRVHGVIESPLLGPKGNREFLMHLTLAPSS